MRKQPTTINKNNKSLASSAAAGTVLEKVGDGLTRVPANMASLGGGKFNRKTMAGRLAYQGSIFNHTV